MNPIDFNNSFSKYYQWAIIGTLLMVAVATVGALVIPQAPQLTLVIAAVLYLAAGIKGMIEMYRSWPIEDDRKGFWSGVKVVFLNVALLGYRGFAFKELPWKAVLTWGIASTIINPNMADAAIHGPEAVIIYAIFAAILAPVFISIYWGIGVVAGKIFK